MKRPCRKCLPIEADQFYDSSPMIQKSHADTCVCKCHKPKPMKRIKKECNCHCHNEFHWFINDKDSCAGITECPHCSPKPMKRIKKEVEKKKHIHRYKVYGSTAVCKCGQIKVKSSPKPTKIEKLIEEIEIRGITITMEDISYFPCIESGTWKRFKKEINNLLSH